MDVLKKIPVREQDPKERATNFKEVCLGYNQEEAQEEASRCINCKNAKCIQGCPVAINIPKFIAEVKEGIVEIKSISREAGSRTKIAVWSNDPDVDPVGACVGMNGARVNAIVSELRGEKIDIINWSDNPAILIENALSPAKVISVMADPDEKTASVIVPDYQLSLAIGKEGQNARLAARLTGYKIDIKSETQAKEMGLFEQMGLQYGDGPAPVYEEEGCGNEEEYEASGEDAAQDDYQEENNEQ